MEAARTNALIGRGTLLFIDEIHRFNKTQQDTLLPYLEDGTVVFIGATTENPSFNLNNALLSRCLSALGLAMMRSYCALISLIDFFLLTRLISYINSYPVLNPMYCLWEYFLFSIL